MTYVKRTLFFRLILRATPAVGALALTAVLCTTPARGTDYPWPVTRVIDGDTIAVDASADLPLELSKLKVRLDGVDTPEKGWRALCEKERVASRAATAFTKQQIDNAKQNAKRIVVRDPKWGAFGGRVIADLVLDGRSLSDALIKGGYGVRDSDRQTKEQRKENRWKKWCSDSGD